MSAPEATTLGLSLSRRPLLLGSAVAALMFPVALTSTGTLNPGPADGPYVLWALAFCLPLIVVVRQPEVSLLLLGVPLTLQWRLSDVPLAADTGALIGLAFLAAVRPARQVRCWTIGLLAVGLVLAVDWTADAAAPGWGWGQTIGALSVFLVVAGLIVAARSLGTISQVRNEQARTWRELAETLERDRRKAVELAAAQERARIAADMHDIVAHSLAVIAVQADAAGLLLRAHRADPDSLDAAGRAVDAIHVASVAALRDTRQLVGVLTGPDAADRAPQPTLADLAGLVRRLDPGQRRFVLRADRPLEHTALSQQGQVAVYRIVAEALANVTMHAGPAASASVTVEHAGPDLLITIADDGLGPQPTERVGQGLANMRRRAGSVGGELRAGPRPGRGFEVCARIPLDEAGGV